MEDELPKKFKDPRARSEKLAEEPCLRRARTDTMFRSVLYVPGNGEEVGQRLVDNVVDDVGLIWAVVVVFCQVGGARYRRGGGGGGGLSMVLFLENKGGWRARCVCKCCGHEEVDQSTFSNCCRIMPSYQFPRSILI